MRPVIQSQKHIVQITFTTSLEGTAVPLKFIEARNSGSTLNAADVVTGSIVKAIYIELWMLANSQQPSTVTVILEKLPGGLEPATASDFTSLHQYDNKKNILYTTQGLVGDANTNPVPFLRGWFKIPRGKQRFGLGDTLQLSFKSITEDTNVCGLAIFKSYQ